MVLYKRPSFQCKRVLGPIRYLVSYFQPLYWKNETTFAGLPKCFHNNYMDNN